MNWNDCEYSVSDGEPVKLYKFVRGDGQKSVTWRYTSADKTIVVNNDDIYTPHSISDNGLNSTSDSSLTITVPANNPIVDLFRGVPPTSVIWVWVYVLHETSNEARLFWFGKVAECKRNETETAELYAPSIMNDFARNGIRLCWRRGCPHVLFDHNCRAKKSQFVVTAVVTSMDGASLTLSGVTQEDHWFTAGFIEWEEDGVIERRSITEQVGEKVSLLGGTVRLKVGLSISLYPGCGLTMKICDEKFDNHLNFGGVNGMPGNSPFDGRKIF